MIEKTNNLPIICIDPNTILEMADTAGKLMFTPEAEKELVRLLELKKWVDATVDKVKENIAQAGESIMPNFTGVAGATVRCSYRVYGGKYVLTDQQLAQEFITKKEKAELDSKKVDKYVSEHGVLPDGINERERSKILSVTLKDEKLLE